jgi:peptide/nickel transport system substrate-binding protein
MRQQFFLAVAAMMLATPAFGQKTQGTLRLSINDPFPVLSPYHLPYDEAGNFSRAVYETLLAYDERAKKYVPSMAKSWKQISPAVTEFELRDDVKFHNGSTFNADDVVATVNYLIDPQSKIVYPQRYNWITKVEKLGSHKIRIVTDKPSAVDLSSLAFRLNIWDGEALNALPDKADYGRLSPVGTGIYKVIQIDKNKGIDVEVVANYYGDKKYFGAGIQKIRGVPIPDRQTQIAELMTGGIDLLRNATPDDVANLVSNPNLRVTNTPSSSIYYLALDAAGRSGNLALKDIRVRKAIWMAIDRDSIIKYVVPGGQAAATKLDALCFPSTIACKYTVVPPAYDPEGAKKLLAEAGYSNGFDLEYDVPIPNKAIGEAIAGQLLKVGIRAKVNPNTIQLYRRKQGDGKLEAWSRVFPTGSFPDADNIVGVLFDGPVIPYYNDESLQKWMAEGAVEIDLAKRTEIYRQLFDRVNQQYYSLPISSIPTSNVHSKDVRIEENALSVSDSTIADYKWN